MIVVKVELHSAITGEVETLSQVLVDNVGGSARLGNYRVRSFRKGAPDVRQGLVPPRPVREGKVLNHPRQSQHVLHLIAKALRALGYGK
jgi:hypothetical protein